MKRLLFCLMVLVAPVEAPAQARTFNQAELDALLAPIALYPDALLSQIFEASTRPGQVAQATRWTRANPQLAGDDAVNAAADWGWHPSVTALTAFPDLLQRMDDNPQWLRDLSEAFRESEPYVMETVQQLRRRAQATGNLRSDDRQQVYDDGNRIAVQPVYAQPVVVPYYDPLLVFGSWWWTSYRPVVWRPWIARPVHWHWHHRPVHRPAPPVAGPMRPVYPSRPTFRAAPERVVHSNGAPSPAAQAQAAQTAEFLRRQREFASRVQIAQNNSFVPATVRAPAVRPAAPVVHQAPAPMVVHHRASTGHVARVTSRASTAPSRGR